MLTVLTLLASLAAPAALSPDDAVRAALIRDPALVSRVADVDAAAGVRRGSLLFRANPEVELSRTTDGSRITGTIVQPLSLTGEGFNALRSAGARLDAARALAERGRYETAAVTRRAYARAVLAREVLRFADEDRVLLARLRGVAELRLKAGEGVDLDLRLARLEEARALAGWLEADSEAAAADAELAALIGVPPGELAHDPLVAGPAVPGEATPRSDLVAATASTRAARAALARERSAIFPAIGLGAFYEKDSGAAIYGPSIAFQIPIWSWNHSGRGAARGDLRRAMAVEASTTARATVEELRAAARLKVAEESLAGLPADIAAEAAPATKAIEGLYASGQANLSDTLLMRARVVGGQRAWMEARAAVANARIDVALTQQSRSLLPTGP